jgi:hypothetical protein
MTVEANGAVPSPKRLRQLKRSCLRSLARLPPASELQKRSIILISFSRPP